MWHFMNADLIVSNPWKEEGWGLTIEFEWGGAVELQN